MPYIDERDRHELQDGLRPPVTSGELNFMFTCQIVEYLVLQGKTYSTMNAIVGALEQAKDEFQRRIIRPYEDKKILENSDVYPEEVTL